MKLRVIQLRRAGFTLVELLVAMALIVLIMSVLAQSFADGLNALRRMKAVGDMQDNLRAAVVPLRNDLLQRHFLASEKLNSSYTNYTRPTAGFFRVQQGLSPTFEGNDADGLPSFLATTDILHLSVIVVGDRRENYFSAPPDPISAGTGTDGRQWLWQEGPPDYQSIAPDYFMNSQRAEVMWFLVPMIDASGQPMTAGASTTPLHSLHRRQRLLMVDNNAQVNTGATRIAAANIGQFPEIACRPDPLNSNVLYFPSLTDIATPSLRSMMDIGGTTSVPDPFVMPRTGQDRVIADVISFEIRIMRPGDFQFHDIRTIQALYPAQFPALNGIFDTATWPIMNPADTSNTNKIDLSVTLKAVQIVIRVWDAKTEQVRQVTLIQDM